MLADLKIVVLPIPDELRKRLLEVGRENLDASVKSPTDLGRTSVVIHTIKNRKARPLRHILRSLTFARRKYLEQEVERLMSVGAFSTADLGNCPYALRTVVTPKKDGTMRICVDYRDVNPQTEKDFFPLLLIDKFN